MLGKGVGDRSIPCLLGIAKTGKQMKQLESKQYSY